jgi:hypothetical protein
MVECKRCAGSGWQCAKHRKEGYRGARANRIDAEGWTFRRDSSLLTFRRSTNSGRATKLRYDRGGGHFILERQ